MSSSSFILHPCSEDKNGNISNNSSKKKSSSIPLEKLNLISTIDKHENGRKKLS